MQSILKLPLKTTYRPQTKPSEIRDNRPVGFTRQLVLESTNAAISPNDITRVRMMPWFYRYTTDDVTGRNRTTPSVFGWCEHLTSACNCLSVTVTLTLQFSFTYFKETMQRHIQMYRVNILWFCGQFKLDVSTQTLKSSHSDAFPFYDRC